MATTDEATCSACGRRTPDHLAHLAPRKWDPEARTTRRALLCTDCYERWLESTSEAETDG